MFIDSIFDKLTEKLVGEIDKNEARINLQLLLVVFLKEQFFFWGQ